MHSSYDNDGDRIAHIKPVVLPPPQESQSSAEDERRDEARDFLDSLLSSWSIGAFAATWNIDPDALSACRGIVLDKLAADLIIDQDVAKMRRQVDEQVEATEDEFDPELLSDDEDSF